MNVFISHSSVDTKFVLHLAKDLRTREGIDAWLDRWEINPGDRIPERLEEGLSEAEVFILVLSPDSINSKWVEYERQAWLAMQIEEEKRAKEESRPPARRLIPVLYRDCPKPPFLQLIHHVKITDQEYENGFKQLVNAIMGVSEKPPLKEETRAPVAPEPNVPRRIYVLTLLKSLFSSQFKEVVFIYNMPNAYLPTNVSQVEKAITLIRYAEQREGEAISELLYRVTPEKFYTFRPEAAWLGVFRGWDAPRSFHSELVQRVVDASDGRNNCPAAAIVGHGGSSKSVALRRLAVDLAEQGYKVWWVEEPEQLLQFGVSQIADVGNDPQFLLVDDIQSLEDEYARRFKRNIQKNRSLILVVAGRKLPPAFHVQVRQGACLFDPYKEIDAVSILDKIAVTIPEWADTAEKLKVEPLRKARLIRILVVLARRKAAPRNLEELETAFLEILVDDISKIRSTLPGLADAVIDAAAIREMERDISRETFIALADYHQPEASIPTLLEEISGNPRWQALESLLSYNPEYDTVQFHHDELAEGIILAGQHGLLGSCIIGDDAWREATLDMVICRGSKPSSSYALSGFVRNHPDVISQKRALKYIGQLIAAENSHHAYLRLIVDEALDLDPQERIYLLLAVARVVPSNRWLWGTVRGWIQRNYQKKDEMCEVLEQLYRAGCRGSPILIPLLQYLPHTRACIIAKSLLADKTTDPTVLCACLNLLADAYDIARKMLDIEAGSPGFLSPELHLQAEKIIRGEGQIWSASKEETS